LFPRAYSGVTYLHFRLHFCIDICRLISARRFAVKENLQIY
jgi:hypothetical protein